MALASRLSNAAAALALPALVLAAWEISAQLKLVSSFLLPTLSGVLTRIVTEIAGGEMLLAAAGTVYRLVVSYVLAVVMGVALGIMMARIAVVRWFLDPIVSIGFPAPKISFLPIFVLWFGLFDAPKIIMACFGCIFPIIAGTWAGTQGVDKYLIWSAENLGARRTSLLWQIVLPAALPQIFTAMQVALPIAFIVVIVAEMLTGGTGLGGAMIEGARHMDPTQVYANVIIIGVIGYLAMISLRAIRRTCLAWHEEVQRQGSIV